MIIWNEHPQGTDGWLKEKLGKPSASNASKIVTNKGEPSKQAEGYLYELVAQRLSGRYEETYKNAYMEMGNEREAESRGYYELIEGVEVTQVGLVYPDENKQYLCSPDGIINNEYGLELKNVLGKTQVKYLLDNKLPSEYFAQVQMSLLVTGFKFWDFCSYSPGLDPLIIRVKPDKEFIGNLERQLKLFSERLEKTYTQLKGEK